MAARLEWQARAPWSMANTASPATVRPVRVSLIALLLIGHVPLGLLVSKSPSLATLHAGIALVTGVGFALGGRRYLDKVAYVAAYIVGAEVLWRMSEALLWWEFGKYAVIIILVVAMFRSSMVKLHGPTALYFGLLLPSVFLTLFNAEPSTVKALLSFNLSGPLTLFVCAAFFSQVKLRKEQLVYLLISLSLPILCIAIVAFTGTVTNPDLQFTTESNYDASGGFGPNQVSSALGLGVLALLLCILNDKTARLLKVLLVVPLGLMAVQSALTFSRGGLYNVVGAILAASPFLVRNPESRMKFFAAVVLILGIGYFIVVPTLVTFTQGAIITRFEDTDPTGRTDLIRTDLEIGAEHPLMGVGPGMAQDLRGATGRAVAAHTEFSRLIAEHGSLGVIALFALIFGIFDKLRGNSSLQEKANSAALFVWCILFMLNAAMRSASPAFIFGLAFSSMIAQQVRPWVPRGRGILG